MGGHPYWYFVPFQPNAQVALDELREREFRAGRYSPVMLFPPAYILSTDRMPAPTHVAFGRRFPESAR
jgi:hypothetical protein